MSIELSLTTIEVGRDQNGVIRHLSHVHQPIFPGQVEPPQDPHDLAEDYLQAAAEIYELDPAMLQNTSAEIASTPDTSANELRIAVEKSSFGTTLMQYAQTYFGLPIWEAGVAISIAENPSRVTSSTSTVHYDVSAEEVSQQDLQNLEQPDMSGWLRTVLDLSTEDGAPGEPTINSTRLRVYQYDPDKRYDPQSSQGSLHAGDGLPSLPLPPVPGSIIPGKHYVVLEVLFTLGITLHWRAFIDVKTFTVLYLRAFTAEVVTGKVFLHDPYRLGAPPSTVGATSSDAVLESYATSITLPGLAPASGGIQHLDSTANEFVRVVALADVPNPDKLKEEINKPDDVPPTEQSPFNFYNDDPNETKYAPKTAHFAAVSAYYHCDRIFRLIRDLLGFAVQPTDPPGKFEDLFDGTSFPVPVDHRALDNETNARGPGNAFGIGSGGFRFGLTVPIVQSTLGIATDWSVVCHEFGHAILWDAVHEPNFGFAHSAGDSFAAILGDPESQATDRGLTFPWFPILSNPNDQARYRRHDWTPAQGWGWGGAKDLEVLQAYNEEQILSSTLFRVYQSLGGDSPDINRKRFASDMTVYLIAEAIRLLGSKTIVPTPIPDTFATKLQEADEGTQTTAFGGGHVGGAHHKVIRWSFEEQALYRIANTPPTQKGAAPTVDLYIDDGRGGTYEYQPVWWENQNIWNRLNPDGLIGHQPPVVGVVNHVYVRIRNRGWMASVEGTCKAFKCRPGAGLIWPDDWQPLNPASGLAVPPVGPGGSTTPPESRIIGPFTWTPTQAGHDCLLAYCKVIGDTNNWTDNCNAETIFGPGPIPEWRLVPHDNNIGQRNIVVIGNDGNIKVCEDLSDARFWVKNIFHVPITVVLQAVLPEFMVQRGWGLHFLNSGGASFPLDPGIDQEISMGCIAGTPFAATDIPEHDRLIRILVFAQSEVHGVGGEMGGMTYQIASTL